MTRLPPHAPPTHFAWRPFSVVSRDGPRALASSCAVTSLDDHTAQRLGALLTDVDTAVAAVDRLLSRHVEGGGSLLSLSVPSRHRRLVRVMMALRVEDPALTSALDKWEVASRSGPTHPVPRRVVPMSAPAAVVGRARRLASQVRCSQLSSVADVSSGQRGVNRGRDTTAASHVATCPPSPSGVREVARTPRGSVRTPPSHPHSPASTPRQRPKRRGVVSSCALHGGSPMDQSVGAPIEDGADSDSGEPMRDRDGVPSCAL